MRKISTLIVFLFGFYASFAQAPTVTCPANVTVNTTAGQCGAVVNYAPATVTGSPAPTVSYSVPSGAFFPKGVTTVIVTATNTNGSANCSFTVTVNDAQAPTITCPANITTTTTAGQCGAIVNFPSPVINDNCPFPAGAVVNLQQTASNSIVVGNSVACNSGGIHTDNSYYRIYDLSTLSLTGPLTLNTVSFGIEQAAAPSGSQPVTVKLYTLSGTFSLANLTQVGSQTFTIPNQSGTVFNGTLSTPVTVGPTAKLVIELFTPDGNATSSGFFIGSNTSAETGSSYIAATACGLTNPLTLAAVGFPNMHIVLNASGTLPAVSSVVSVPASGSFFPKGTTTVNSTVTDAAGNTATCSFTVTVNDNIAPAITCPANITVSTPVGSCTATVNYTVTATDNCPGVTTALTAGLASGSAFPIGVTTVTTRATDVAGNQTSCSFTVTVNDGQLPVITTQPAATLTACATDNVNLTVVATNAQSYQWQQYNGTAWVNVAGATSATLALPAITLAGNTGTYRCQVTGRCTSIISNVSSVYVNPLPTVTLVASSPAALLPGRTTDITAVVNPAGGAFAWFKNGVRINGVTSAALTGLSVDDIGTYKVTYTDGNGCKQTSADLAVTAEASDILFVYPNPNTGRFQVRINNSPAEDLYVTVYDSKGTKVYQKKVTTSAISYSRLDVDLGLKASGLFIVEIRDAGGKQIASRPILVLQR